MKVVHYYEELLRTSFAVRHEQHNCFQLNGNSHRAIVVDRLLIKQATSPWLRSIFVIRSSVGQRVLQIGSIRRTLQG